MAASSRSSLSEWIIEERVDFWPKTRMANLMFGLAQEF